MAGFDCELHGPQFAIPMCEHLEAAVERRESLAAYLQYPTAVALCDACVRRRDVPDPWAAASSLVCCACLLEWEARTGNRFARRCRRARNEYPPGFSPPPDFVAPEGAIRVSDATFWLSDEWRVVTRTGAWRLSEYPQGFWCALNLPWPRVRDVLSVPGGAPFPIAEVVDSALVDAGLHTLSRVGDYILAGFPVSPGRREAMLRALDGYPPRLPMRAAVRAALGAPPD